MREVLCRWENVAALSDLQTPSCIGSNHGGGFALGNLSVALDSNLLDGITFCVYDAEYPFSQIEHAIKYHYHAVASIYKV